MKYREMVLMTLLMALLPFVGMASGRMESKVGVIKGGYNFWLYTPEKFMKPDTVKRPLIVFLHGASLCGTNLQRVRRYGVLHVIDRGMDIESMVVAPQNPGGAWKPSKVDDVVEWVKSNYPIDTSRVYVMGMSLGGYGTMDYANTYPEKIAAAMALCGGCSYSKPDGLGRLPLWIMHGTADRAVSMSKSQTVVDYLRSTKSDSMLRYDKVAGASHSYLARVFYVKKVYEWLLKHNTDDRTVDRTIRITKSDMNAVY